LYISKFTNHNNNGDNVNENLEVISHIYKDCDASISSLTTMLKDLKNKDNKIKETTQNILKGYERYLKESKNLLKKGNVEPEKMGLIPKMMAKMGVDREVKNDNSDASMASMLIQGIQMGVLDIEKKLKQYEKTIDKKAIKFVEEFKNFQQDNIEALKKHL